MNQNLCAIDQEVCSRFAHIFSENLQCRYHTLVHIKIVLLKLNLNKSLPPPFHITMKGRLVIFVGDIYA